MEYFGFAAYGFLASIPARVFFPSHDPTVPLPRILGVLAVAYVASPGGPVSGHLGEGTAAGRLFSASGGG